MWPGFDISLKHIIMSDWSITNYTFIISSLCDHSHENIGERKYVLSEKSALFFSIMNKKLF